VFGVTKALCPIDFSPASEHALDAAVGAAAAFGAEVYLLHVLEGPAMTPAASEAARDRLASLVATRLPAERLHLLVSDGDPAEEILRMEEIFGVDLVVLAPHSRPTIGRILFGSVAERVARGARANVLLVKRHLVDDISAPESN
jgi:nucleotide-binding universal stress UspA family protein